MSTALPFIPFQVAKLIIGFTHNKLSKSEVDELDRWVEDSDENMEAFEDLTSDVDDNVVSPDDLII